MESADIINKKRKTHLTAGLWLLIAPTALLIIGFMAFAVINWVTAGVASPTIDTTCPSETAIKAAVDCSSTPESLFGGSSTGSTIANVILFIVSAIGVITWLPGLIIGIVLLATMPPKPAR